MLVAGATGYLGGHIVSALNASSTDFIALARNTTKLKEMGIDENNIRVAEVTNPSSLLGCCDDIDVVISCVGITRQKDGLKYIDVDYQANCNLLDEAERAGVKKFIYISAFNAPKFQKVRLLKAKEAFANKLLKSTRLTPSVIRPNGFFSDLEEYYDMVQSGRAYVFGNGSIRLNPIHGADLADVCLEAVDKNEHEIDVGGPDILSVTQIVELAFEAQKRQAKVIYLPECLRKVAISTASLFPERYAGALEFFLSVSATNMIAPTYGTRTLEAYFKEIALRATLSN
ncbi:SDR family oxidoreductase [Psychromonas sp. KJ10-10]|uniref:SDR family oxidoreductase n=1 Tax=Psychromonas sp. KJ10-10 TaxID=3391823 RepID=UPI0039B62897